jgi:hypothetical protein
MLVQLYQINSFFLFSAASKNKCQLKNCSHFCKECHCEKKCNHSCCKEKMQKQAKKQLSEMISFVLKEKFKVNVYFGPQDKLLEGMTVENFDNFIEIKKFGISIKIDSKQCVISPLFKNEIISTVGDFWGQIISNKNNLNIIENIVEQHCSITEYSNGHMKFKIKGFDGIFSVKFVSSSKILELKQVDLLQNNLPIAKIWKI